jgi:hypothetical protein
MRAIPAPRKALRHPRFRRVILVDRIRIRLGVHPHIRRRRRPHHVPDIRARKLGIKVVGRLVRLDDGFEGRRELLERERLPVNVVEKGVFFEFGSAALSPETVFRVAVEELSKEIELTWEISKHEKNFGHSPPLQTASPRHKSRPWGT